MEDWGKQLNQIRKYTLISLDHTGLPVYQVIQVYQCCARVAVDEAATATKDLNNAFVGLCANKVQANKKFKVSLVHVHITLLVLHLLLLLLLLSDDT